MMAPEMGALKTPGGVLRADFGGAGWRREAGGLAWFSPRRRRLDWVSSGGGVGIVGSVRKRVP